MVKLPSPAIPVVTPPEMRVSVGVTIIMDFPFVTYGTRQSSAACTGTHIVGHKYASCARRCAVMRGSRNTRYPEATRKTPDLSATRVVHTQLSLHGELMRLHT